MSSIRILIADDHPIVRDGLAAVLSTQSDFEVVGQAGTGREVLDSFAQLAPDLLLLDLEMPELDGVQTLTHLRAEGRDVHAIVFTAFDTDDRIVEAIRAGAQAYLLKGAPREELFNAVRVVHGGGTLLQPVIASKLMRRLQEDDRVQAETLTARELEVLKLLSVGSTNRDIAGDLIITERTVKFHVSSIMGKLGASNRTEAVALARTNGLLA